MGYIEIHKIIEVYAKDDDLTFIMKEIRTDNDDLLSKEVIGWYYGKPSENNTKKFMGCLYKDFRES